MASDVSSLRARRWASLSVLPVSKCCRPTSAALDRTGPGTSLVRVVVASWLPNLLTGKHLRERFGGPLSVVAGKIVEHGLVYLGEW
jgi:hypothetical protein